MGHHVILGYGIALSEELDILDSDIEKTVRAHPAAVIGRHGPENRCLYFSIDRYCRRLRFPHKQGHVHHLEEYVLSDEHAREVQLLLSAAVRVLIDVISKSGVAAAGDHATMLPPSRWQAVQYLSTEMPVDTRWFVVTEPEEE